MCTRTRVDVLVLTASSRPGTLSSEKESTSPRVAQQGPPGASGPAVSASEVSAQSWRPGGGSRAGGGQLGEPRPLPALASLPRLCLWSCPLPPRRCWDPPQVPGSEAECHRLPGVPGTVCLGGRMCCVCARVCKVYDQLCIFKLPDRRLYESWVGEGLYSLVSLNKCHFLV